MSLFFVVIGLSCLLDTKIFGTMANQLNLSSKNRVCKIEMPWILSFKIRVIHQSYPLLRTLEGSENQINQTAHMVAKAVSMSICVSIGSQVKIAFTSMYKRQPSIQIKGWCGYILICLVSYYTLASFCACRKAWTTALKLWKRRMDPYQSRVTHQSLSLLHTLRFRLWPHKAFPTLCVYNWPQSMWILAIGEFGLKWWILTILSLKTS